MDEDYCDRSEISGVWKGRDPEQLSMTMGKKAEAKLLRLFIWEHHKRHKRLMEWSIVIWRHLCIAHVSRSLSSRYSLWRLFWLAAHLRLLPHNLRPLSTPFTRPPHKHYSQCPVRQQ